MAHIGKPGVTDAIGLLARYGAAGTDFLGRLLRVIAWPKVELLIRLWLAKIFFVSGVLKLFNWQTALYLAAYEYPVRFLSAGAAASIGVSIEVLGATLFAVGFMTRYAAATMLCLAIVTQVAYRQFDTQLFWAALFGWYTVCGAGPFSLDNLLRRGLATSALPVIPTIVRLSGWIKIHAGPVYISVMRIWLSVALLAVAPRLPPNRFGSVSSLALWLPVDLAGRIPGGMTLPVGALLFLGLATRYVGVAVIIALFADAMMDPRATDAIYLLMIFSIFSVYGGGSVSVDRLLALLVNKRFPAMELRDPRRLEGLPRVVIVGAGFGGISCASALRKARVSVTLIDRTNFHLFQPLLYQVATAALSPGDIAAPVRRLFREHFGVRALLGVVSGIDTQKQSVRVDEQDIGYDYLVLATGASHSYFGREGWARYAPGLKRIEDALEIRRRILTAFEEAEATNDPDRRASLLTFLIVGGGPTGVELAGAIAELARLGMDKEFRMFDPTEARVILVQSAPRLLPAFAESLSALAQRALEKLGVRVLVRSRVEDIDASGVVVNGIKIAAGTVLWAAGVSASAAGKWLNVPCDNAGRVKVGADLSVPGIGNVFVIGDTASSNGWKGNPVPGLASAAKQGGTHAAKQILAKIAARPAPPAFRYRHLGSLATIGRKAAVADFGSLKLWGEPAWWLWGIVHLGFLVGTRNRISTTSNWLWTYLTFGGAVRLITGSEANVRPKFQGNGGLDQE